MTLSERLAEINAEAARTNAADNDNWDSGLVSDLDHWAGYGVTTAEELDDYLDSCVEHEIEKGSFH